MKAQGERISDLENQYSDAMNMLQQQLEDLQCASVASQGRMDKLEREVVTSERELSVVQECLEGHNEQLAALSKKSSDLAKRAESQESQFDSLNGARAGFEKQVNEHRMGIDRLATDFQRMEEKTCSQAEIIQAGRAKLQSLEVQLTKAEEERLAELKVVCEKVERQESDAQVMATQLRTQLRACRHAYGNALEDMKKDLEVKLDGKAAACDMNQALQDLTGLKKHVEAVFATKLGAEEIEKTHVALHDWVNQTRETLRTWLSQNLQDFAAQQSAKLEEHQGWVTSVTGWIEQVHVREKGLSHVLLHVVEQESPDLMKMLEQALKMPQQPKLKKSLTA